MVGCEVDNGYCRIETEKFLVNAQCLLLEGRDAKRRSGSCQIGFESCAVEVGRGALVGASEMGWMGGGG